MVIFLCLGFPLKSYVGGKSLKNMLLIFVKVITCYVLWLKCSVLWLPKLLSKSIRSHISCAKMHWNTISQLFNKSWFITLLLGLAQRSAVSIVIGFCGSDNRKKYHILVILATKELLYMRILSFTTADCFATWNALSFSWDFFPIFLEISMSNTLKKGR